MNTLQTIFTRKSVRTFTDKPISEADVHTILRAGMSGPTCVNARQWSFIVVDEKDMLLKMAATNGRPARPLEGAALGILVCGDMSRAFEPAPEYWTVDCSIACQNMILAAHSLEIGSVWLGTWPQMDRVEKQKELFGLSEQIIPHSIIAFGYAAGENTERDLYEEDRVHFNRW